MTADLYGRVDFAVDMTNGIVNVTVTPPFGIEGSQVTAKTSLLDVLDLAARVTLELNAQHRAAIAARTGQLSLAKA